MSRRRSHGGLALLVLLALLSCTSETDDAVDAVTSAEWIVDPEPLLSIGEVEGDPEYIFDGVAAVRLLPDSRIVVADRSSGTIRIYDTDGQLERQMGGVGDGPGEFRYLSSLSIAPPDTIVAYDSKALRLTNYLATGDLVSTLSFQVPDGYPELYVGSHADESHTIAWIRQVPGDPSVVTPDLMQLGRFAEDGRLTTVLAEGFGMRRLDSPIPFSPHFLATMIGDTIFHTDGLGGTVHATEPAGELVRTLDVPTAGWDIADARRRLEAELDSAAARLFGQLDDAPTPDSIPTIAELISDGEGHLWAKRYDPATDSHWIGRPRTGGEWLVLESDGAVVARVEVPPGVRLVEVSGDRIAGIALDEYGVERIQLFALRHREPTFRDEGAVER